MTRAPVAMFAYRRAGHLRRALASLAANPPARDTDLFLFCDGAKGRRDAAQVAAVRAVARAASGFRSLTVVERERNLGLARSLIAGITELLERSERVIVVEDDLVLSPYFLGFMNDALELYAGDERVASVHGYLFPVRAALPETFFLLGADCWGWATWRRAWRHFEPDAAALLRRLRERRLEREFDLDGAYPYTRMLELQARGKLDSWAIRWRASCYLAGLVTLYPGRSVVRNAGLDRSGTHRDDSTEFEVKLADAPVGVQRIPVEPSAAGRAAYAEFLGGLQSHSRLRRAWRYASWLVRRVHARA